MQWDYPSTPSSRLVRLKLLEHIGFREKLLMLTHSIEIGGTGGWLSYFLFSVFVFIRIWNLISGVSIARHLAHLNRHLSAIKGSKHSFSSFFCWINIVWYVCIIMLIHHPQTASIKCNNVHPNSSCIQTHTPLMMSVYLCPCFHIELSPKHQLKSKAFNHLSHNPSPLFVLTLSPES